MRVTLLSNQKVHFAGGQTGDSCLQSDGSLGLFRVRGGEGEAATLQNPGPGEDSGCRVPEAGIWERATLSPS